MQNTHRAMSLVRDNNLRRVFLASLIAILSLTGFFAISGSAYAAPAVTLGVTQITANQTFATADGTYTNGWKWTFDVTVPDNEPIVNMKFADWVNGSSTIPAANNIQFYSAQSLNAIDEAHAIPITAAATYSADMNLNTTMDLDVMQAGRQIQIVVEARVPAGSAGGSYSTSYGIKSNVDTVPPVITLLGTTPVTVAAGSVYVDAGATAMDNIDGDITSNIVTVNPVNTAIVGAYVVTYNVSDAAGNAATQVTRTVVVVADIVSVTPSAPITTAFGTDFLSLTLPATVDVTLSDTSTNTLPVVWSGIGYNSAVAGTYTLNGTVTLPADGSITNSTNLTASIDVTVAAPLDIAAIPASAPVNAVLGTDFLSLTLPATVDVTLSDSSIATLPVVWSGTGYNGTTAATYTLTGAVTLPANGSITNSTNLTASIDVTVVAPLNITSVTPSAPISVAVGTAFSALTLPTTVTVVLSDSTTVDLSVAWAQGTYNGAVAGIYTLTGTVTLPSDGTITNSTNATASIDVTVAVPEE